MHNWSNLPIEILEKVFKLVAGYSEKEGHESLCQCQLVCENWKLPAQRSLFFKIAVYDEEQAKSLLEALKNSRDFPGRRTRRLYYSLKNNFFDESKDITYYQHDTYLTSFIQAFPNLDRIGTSEPNYAFYVILLTARKFSQLKFLKVIEESKVNEDLRIYVDCVLAYRDSLTHLLLCDSLDDIYIGPNNENGTMLQIEQYNRLAQELDTFSQLTHLKLEKHTNNNCLKDNLDCIIDNCRNLQSFEFTIQPLEDTTTAPITTTNSLDISFLSARPDITTVDGNWYINNDNILLYLMHKFPNLQHMQLVDIFSISIWATDRQTKYTPEVVANFLTYITKIPHHRVEGIYVKTGMIPDIMLAHYNTLENVTHDLCIEYRRSHSYSRTEGEINQDCAALELTSPDLLEEYQHQFGIRYFIKYEEREHIPHFNLLERAGHLIKTLEIDLIEAHEHPLLFQIVKDGDMLNNISRHCTGLQQLTLALYKRELGCIMNMPTRNESLTDLIVHTAQLCNGFCALIIELAPNLKVLKFEDCTTAEGEKSSSVLNMPDATLDELYWKDSGDYGRIVIDKLGLNLVVGGTTKYYLFEKGSPNVPVDVSEEEFRNLSKEDNFTSVYIRCRSVTRLSVSVGLFLFEKHNHN